MFKILNLNKKTLQNLLMTIFKKVWNINNIFWRWLVWKYRNILSHDEEVI